ncbi:MAG: right-handed parallel beta-helix repeat-containing protein, partial [Oscillospiraceae bacterium]|nr:right-handed parallel beta-helix repeat-containing protein [Oscillospiraceae bacterium]
MKTKKLFKKITSMLIAITMVFGLMPMLGQEVAKADTRASEIVADLPNDVQYSLKIGDDEFEGSKEELETFLDELEIPDSVEIKLFLDEDFQEEWEGEEDVPLFALSNIADNQTELANLINNSTFPTIVIKGNQIGTMSSFNIASTINLNTTRVVTLEAFYSGGAWLASNVGTRHFSISSSAMIYFTLVNVQFRGNGIGGGIYNQGVFSITGANTIPGFININTCKAPSGAGISNDSSGVVVLRGNAIIANGEATISGGGVCSHGDRFEIRDSVKIENNTPDNICGSVSDYRVATPEPSPFQLHYNANGGTGSHTEYIYYDEWPHTVWAPEQIGISNGALVLTAWTTNSNGTGLGWRPQEGIWGPEDLISPEGGPPNTTLYAKWATPFPTIVPTTPPTIAPTARPTSAPRPAGIYYHVQNGSKVINGFIAHSVNPTTDVKSKVANTHFEISDWYTNSSFTSSWTTGQGAGTAIDIYAYSNVADNQATLNFLLNRASFGTILIRHENSSAFEFEMEYDAEDGAISGLPPGDPEELFRELGEDAEADIITLTSAIDIGASREVVFRPYSGDVAYIISAIGVRHFDIAKRSPAPSPPATSTPATSKPPESGNPDGPGGDISGIPEEPPEMVGTFIVDLTFRNVQLWGTMKGAGGGGIYNKDATLHLRGTGEFANFANIENCRATNGGGIYNEGTLNLHNRMLISHNTASNQGGGVYNNGKLFMNDNSKIEKNTASAAGGVRNNGSNSVITMNNNATISENTGTFHTGGVYNLGGAFEMRDSSSVADNTSNSYGGGISNSDNGIIILKDTAKIIGNSAATNGGGIWTNNLSKITAEEGVKFADNTAAIPYFLTDQAGIDLHNVQILTTSFSDYGNPFLLLPPFEYAYNNYDINYVDANPPTPYATAAPATTPPSAGPTEAPTPEPGATHQPTN